MSREELRSVLSHWDLAGITSLQELHLGSTRAPKVIVTCTDGKFLLKRFAKVRTDPVRTAFQHQLHRSLQGAGFPVTELMQLRSNAGTLLEVQGHSYELCRYIDGSRFAGTTDEAQSSGSRLAGFHDLTKTHLRTAPPGRGFHARDDVAKVAARLQQTRPELDSAQCGLLHDCMKQASFDASARWASLPTTVVHGDWHPGNLLFGEWGVSAVLDLETVRADARIAELANALLQFSMPVGRGGAAPDVHMSTPDLDMLRAVLKGWALMARDQLIDAEVQALPPLMLEALCVEAAIALHRKGRFNQWSGPDFLSFVCHRAAWIKSHADDIRSMAVSP
ncbi:MAG: phosphotransferase [Phycisphaerales bacterium]|nr:phosphotransferase [Phycisphaerales bacterium]